MITHIRTVGFKGFDIDEPILQKVIYSGRNKSGKSARAGAIAIALYGHIPFSTAGKKPGNILDSFGNDSLVASVTIGGTEFARKFSRNEKGSVSQVVQLNEKRVSTENFAIMLNKAGAPKIADVAEFMKQSEAKKIDTLFELFPNEALATIDTEIENAKYEVSRIEKKKSGAESTVVRLNNSKQAIEIPSGSIAEVQSEIKNAEFQIADLEEQIKQAEIEEAEVKAKAEGKKEAEQEAAEEPLKTDEDWEKAGIDNMPSSPEMAEIDKTITGMKKQIDDFNSGNLQSPEPFQSILKSDVFDSIQCIIDALNGTGCGTCAALIVAKQELKKFKGVS